MLDLQTLANYAEVLGAVTVVGGATFAIFQIRELRRQRNGAMAAELMRSFYNAELGHAVHLIQKLPDDTAAVDLRACGAEYEEAAILVATTFETVGLLVHREMAPFPFVRDLMGGLVVAMSRKLRVWLEDVRIEQSHPNFGEWFQWLAEQMADQPAAAPAFELYRDWKPRS